MIKTAPENHQRRNTESRRHGMRMEAMYPWDDPEARIFAPPATARRTYTDYVSAACLEVRGITDDKACYEVMLLRLFAREYVEKLHGGPRMISDYREKAQVVTRAIENQPARLEVYVDLYERFIGPLIEKIQYGRWEEAHEFFRRMREETEDHFLRRASPGPEM